MNTQTALTTTTKGIDLSAIQRADLRPTKRGKIREVLEVKGKAAWTI